MGEFTTTNLQEKLKGACLPEIKQQKYTKLSNIINRKNH